VVSTIECVVLVSFRPMKNFCTVLAVVVVSLGCITTNDAVMSAPTSVFVTKKAEAYVWAQVQAYVVRRATMKIQISNDVLIQTYSPRTGFDTAFTVTKVPTSAGDGCMVDVTGSDRDAHELAEQIAIWATSAGRPNQ
jgi:hypothetical protein